ncbi:hypothetical protein SESBI_45542 [Sesbania bispinosa]|nr:hypothetical protein SESBI_45542 [Sesbania bispinosa]
MALSASNKLMSFATLLAILLFLVSSVELVSAAQPNGRKLLQQGYGGYPGGGGYGSYPGYSRGPGGGYGSP